MKKQISILMTAFIFLVGAPPMYSSAPHTWPFRDNGRIWHRAMSPASGALIVNDRPVKYPPLKAEKEQEALKTFKEAIQLASEENDVSPCPELLIATLCNLAAFEYRLSLYDQSKQHFSEALKLAQDAPALLRIDILEDFAVVCRAAKNYAQAKSLYEQALQLKHKNGSDDKSAEHGMSHANLAALAHDAYDSAAVERHHAETHRAVGGSQFVSATTTSDQPRPLSTSGLRKAHDCLGDMLVEARTTIDTVRERQGSRQQEELARRAEERKKEMARREEEHRKQLEAARAEQLRRQQIADALNAKSNDVEVATPFADVSGRVIYAVKDDPEFMVSGAQTQLRTAVKEGNDKRAQAIPVDLIFCKYEVRDAIARYLVAAAKDRTQKIEELGDQWPSTKIQAKPIIQALTGIAVAHKLKRLSNSVTSSNIDGEYIFRGIPKGQFFIFAPLPTKSEYLFWLVPVSVQDRKEITIDLAPENVAHHIWRASRDIDDGRPR